MASSNGPSLAVVFSTQTPYPLPSQKFMIPASWKRYQLSQLVNKALSLVQPVPFDFLVKGEILRTSLAEWCAENGIGEACVVCILNLDILLIARLCFGCVGRNA
jgi:ribosome biogenesis protein